MWLAPEQPAWPLEGAGCDAARRLQERKGGPRLAGRARAQTRSFLWHAVYLPGAQGGPDKAPGLGRNRAGAGDEAPARWKVPLATPGRRGDEAVGGASLGADRRVGLVARACSASAQTVTCAVGRMPESAWRKAVSGGAKSVRIRAWRRILNPLSDLAQRPDTMSFPTTSSSSRLCCWPSAPARRGSSISSS